MPNIAALRGGYPGRDFLPILHKTYQDPVKKQTARVAEPEDL
jgi:hypothetical protein